MLSDEDKLRIREEEAFRLQVQRLLQANQSATFRQNLWRFVNSAFGLWFFSTVILGFIALIYTRAESTRLIKAQNREEVLKLDVEIAARLDSVRIPPLPPFAPETGLVEKLLLPPEPSKVLVPEFSNRNLRSLLYELSLRVPVEERSIILTMIDTLQWLEKEYDGKGMALDQSNEFRTRVDNIYHGRWDPLNTKIRNLRPD